ncbi:hypothetical protein Tco_0444467 [Tanacetum coccineum]
MCESDSDSDSEPLNKQTTPKSKLGADGDHVSDPTLYRILAGWLSYDSQMSSKRQVTLSRYRFETEYRGVANAVAETCWLRNVLYITSDDMAPPYGSGGCSTSESSDFSCGVKRCRFDDDFDCIFLSSIMLELTESVDDPLLETEKAEVYVSSDELAESSEDMDLKDIYLTGDFMSSGAALWEHPNKVDEYSGTNVPSIWTIRLLRQTG